MAPVTMCTPSGLNATDWKSEPPPLDLPQNAGPDVPYQHRFRVVASSFRGFLQSKAHDSESIGADRGPATPRVCPRKVCPSLGGPMYHTFASSP